MIHLLATQLKEYETIRMNQGTQSAVITVDITASLTSDSGLAKN